MTMKEDPEISMQFSQQEMMEIGPVAINVDHIAWVVPKIAYIRFKGGDYADLLNRPYQYEAEAKLEALASRGFYAIQAGKVGEPPMRILVNPAAIDLLLEEKGRREIYFTGHFLVLAPSEEEQAAHREQVLALVNNPNVKKPKGMWFPSENFICPLCKRKLKVHCTPNYDTGVNYQHLVCVFCTYEYAKEIEP